MRHENKSPEKTIRFNSTYIVKPIDNVYLSTARINRMYTVKVMGSVETELIFSVSKAGMTFRSTLLCIQWNEIRLCFLNNQNTCISKYILIRRIIGKRDWVRGRHGVAVWKRRNGVAVVTVCWICCVFFAAAWDVRRRVSMVVGGSFVFLRISCELDTVHYILVVEYVAFYSNPFLCGDKRYRFTCKPVQLLRHCTSSTSFYLTVPSAVR